MEKYKIIRHNRFKGNKVIARGLTLEEAKEHCNRADTRKDGVWFDGYTRD